MSAWRRHDEDSFDDEWEDDERYEDERADEDDRHDEALEQSEEIEQATEHVEENTRELVENQERFADQLGGSDDMDGDGGWNPRVQGAGYLETEEDVIREERQIESSVDGIDEEWEEFFDDRQERDDDTEQEGRWF